MAVLESVVERVPIFLEAVTRGLEVLRQISSAKEEEKTVNNPISNGVVPHCELG